MEYMVREQFPQQHFLTRFFRSCLGELGVDTESLGLFMKMQKKKPKLYAKESMIRAELRRQEPIQDDTLDEDQEDLLMDPNEGV